MINRTRELSSWSGQSFFGTPAVSHQGYAMILDLDAQAARPSSCRSKSSHELTAIQVGLLAQLFPSNVIAAAELRGIGDDVAQGPAKLAIFQNWSRKRMNDFTRGRLCARDALTALGIQKYDWLHIAADRRPAWPNGIVGSITHTDEYAAAVVAKREDVRTLGVDAEITGRISEDMWPLIFNDGEAAWLRAAHRSSNLDFATVVFSAKEAFYKFQFELTRSWLDFHDVKVTVGEALTTNGTFRVDVIRASEPLGRFGLTFYGAYLFSGHVVVTGIAMPATCRYRDVS